MLGGELAEAARRPRARSPHAARATSPPGTSLPCRDSGRPSRSARRRATVLLPAPAGPSMAMIIGVRGRREARRTRGTIPPPHPRPDTRRRSSRRGRRRRRRWRRGGRPQPRSRHPADGWARRARVKPSDVPAMRAPTARSALATVSMRSDSLRAAPLRPRTRLVPRAIDAASANSGSSSIMPRYLGRDDLRRHELGVRRPRCLPPARPTAAAG